MLSSQDKRLLLIACLVAFIILWPLASKLAGRVVVVVEAAGGGVVVLALVWAA
jgi:hypothetical protein